MNEKFRQKAREFAKKITSCSSSRGSCSQDRLAHGVDILPTGEVETKKRLYEQAAEAEAMPARKFFRTITTRRRT